MSKGKNKHYSVLSGLKKIAHAISSHLFQLVLAVIAGSGVLVYGYIKPMMELDAEISQSFNQAIAAVTTSKMAAQQFNLLCQNAPKDISTSSVWLNFAFNMRITLAKEETNLINSVEPLGKLISPQTYCALSQITKEMDSMTSSTTILGLTH